MFWNILRMESDKVFRRRLLWSVWSSRLYPWLLPSLGFSTWTEARPSHATGSGPVGSPVRWPSPMAIHPATGKGQVDLPSSNPEEIPCQDLRGMLP